jgi:hypothetical protein
MVRRSLQGETGLVEGGGERERKWNVHEDLLGLTDTVDTVEGLVLDGGRPGEVYQEKRVSGRRTERTGEDEPRAMMRLARVSVNPTPPALRETVEEGFSARPKSRRGARDVRSMTLTFFDFLSFLSESSRLERFMSPW